MEQVINSLNISLEKNQKFNKYYEFLISENEKYNLTNITELDDVYIKHFYDSLMMSKFIDLKNVENLCDIGSGAGFPSIPLKIMYPHLKITIIEPTLKRINFLKKLCEILELDNVTLINDRAECAIINMREKFDIVTARAVSNLPMLLEICIPYVKVNGLFVAYKGQTYQEEISQSKKALEILKSSIDNIYSYDLFNDYGVRYLLSIRKKEITNTKYPRRYSDIKKKTL